MIQRWYELNFICLREQNFQICFCWISSLVFPILPPLQWKPPMIIPIVCVYVCVESSHACNYTFRTGLAAPGIEIKKSKCQRDYTRAAGASSEPNLHKKKGKKKLKTKNICLFLKCSPHSPVCLWVRIDLPSFNSPLSLKKQSSPETLIACWHLAVSHSLSIRWRV